MNIIIGSPSSGKTKEILAISEEKNIPILCESRSRVERLIIKARGYGFRIPIPVALEDLNDESGIDTVLIDEVDVILERLLNRKVDTITVNVTDPSKLRDLDKR